MDERVIFLVVFMVIMIIISEWNKVTFARAIDLTIEFIVNKFMLLFKKPSQYYPTCIGYDTNGCFCPGAVEKEFEELADIFDSIYLANHGYSNDIIRYDFKFANVKNDISGLELYDFADRKVISIVQRYLHRIVNFRATDNISSIVLDKTSISVYLARTANGEEMNATRRNQQRYAYNNQQVDMKKDRGPIEIKWEDV